MKKIFAILVALIVGLALTGVTFAAEEKKAAEAKNPCAAKEEKKAPEKVTPTTGEVTAVDAKAMTVTIKDKKGKEVTVTVPDAKMMEGVMVGDKVTCKHVEKEGKMVCKSIVKKKAAAKKEEKKGEKK